MGAKKGRGASQQKTCPRRRENRPKASAVAHCGLIWGAGESGHRSSVLPEKLGAGTILFPRCKHRVTRSIVATSLGARRNALGGNDVRKTALCDRLGTEVPIIQDPGANRAGPRRCREQRRA
jgi:hypothetical protein